MGNLSKNRGFFNEIFHTIFNKGKSFCCMESLRHTSIFEVIWICEPIQQEAKHGQEKIHISWTEIKSLLIKPSNVLPSYPSSQNSDLLYSEVDFLKHS